MIRLEQALLSRERVERDYADLEGRAADFRARADRTEAAETLLRVERDSWLSNIVIFKLSSRRRKTSPPIMPLN
ncbi:hypothetical protein PF008_g32285 [Phytophthora fragariae]|uniref:Uncharacterized protein n=1 Tax=Phytophthora fragariae TaxID=53985 RepID=A0A6G0Q0C1_9STRA|nr:hypothetical protein PF008_g32285 [Phytophthora fragariae]